MTRKDLFLSMNPSRHEFETVDTVSRAPRTSPIFRARWLWLIPLALCMFVAPRDGASQPKERPGDNPTANQIAEAVDKAEAGKWLEAIEQFQRVMDTAGDELAPVDRHLQLPARWVAQSHLSKLPPAGLKLYRQRVDGQAARRVTEAKKSPTNTALRKILDEMFNSTASEEAILELARRAFSSGNLEEANHYWRMLLPGPAEDDLIRFPQPKTSPAAIKARLILVKIYKGEREDALAGIEELKKESPDAAGLLAGKNGKYVETLAALVASPGGNTLPPESPDLGWNTFAGRTDRDSNTHASLPYYWPDLPAWKIPLPFPKRTKFEDTPINPFHRNALAFHPVIGSGETLLADGRRVWSVDLKSGVATEIFSSDEGAATIVPVSKEIRHSLTLHRGTLYARLGETTLKPASNDEAQPFSRLVALGTPSADSPNRKLLWKLPPPSAPESTTIWEGCPLVTDEHIYAMFWRQTGGGAQAGVACYRQPAPNETPELLWQRIVGKTGKDPNADHRTRHELLTLSNGLVLVAPHAGSLMALDERTGQAVWEFRYASDDRPTMPRYRDLCPPLASGGKVFFAPVDSDHLFCIDIFDGRLIWDRDGVEVCQLLGVARDRLIATFGGSLKGLRGINVRTGDDGGNRGWLLHDQAGELTFGRGIVTDDVIVWPTRDALIFVSPEDGRPLRSPIPGSFGNLAFGDGCLVVATGTELWCYPSEKKAVSAKPDFNAIPPDTMVWDTFGRPIRAGQLRETPQAKAESAPMAGSPGNLSSPGLLSAPLENRLVRRIDDAGLRILAESPRLIGVGDKLLVGEQSTPNPARHEITFARESSTALILGGPGGITALHPQRLTVMWELLLNPGAYRLSQPSRPTLPLTSGNEPFTTFDSFVLSGDSLLAVHAGRDLLCYSVVDGVLRWGKRIEDLSPKVPISATWSPYAVLSGKFLAVQSSNGIAGILDIDTGAVRRAATTAGKPWIEPPVVTDPGKFLWTEDDAVLLFDSELPRFVERYELPDTVSLSGIPPRLRLHRNDVLLLVERNHGMELDVLQAENLKRKWARPPIFLGNHFEDVAMADDRILVVADNRLTAYSWNEAELLWSRALPESDTPRRLIVTPAGVWVAPTEPEIVRRSYNAIGAFRNAGWNAGRLVRALSDSYDVWTQREWPVMLYGPADGEIIQRWNLPALGPAAGLDVGRTNVSLLTGHGIWRLFPLAEKLEP